MIFCSHPQDIHFSYKRFVENEFRESFGFGNVPIAIHFRERSRNSMNADGVREGPKSSGAARAFARMVDEEDENEFVDFDVNAAEAGDATEIIYIDEDSNQAVERPRKRR